MAGPIEITIHPDECQLLGVFLQQSRELLADVENRVLQMEGVDGQESQLVQDVFLMVHTIKERSEVFGLSLLERLSHRLENLLDAIRQGRKEVDADATDCLLAGMARLRLLVEEAIRATHSPLRTDNGVLLVFEQIEINDVLEWLEKEAASSGAPQAVTPAVAAQAPSQSVICFFPGELITEFLEEVRENLAGVETVLLAAESEPGLAGGHIDAMLREFHTIKGASGLILSHIEDEKTRNNHIIFKVHNLTHAAETLLQVRRNNATMPSAMEIGLLLRVHDTLADLINLFADGAHTGGADVTGFIEECTGASFCQSALPEMIASAKPEESWTLTKETAGELGEEAGPASVEELYTPEPSVSVIKVPQYRLDQLMNQVGELVVNRNALKHLAKLGSVDGQQAELVMNLKSLAGIFGHVVDELETTVREMRMMPVGHTFTRIPRLLRELARILKKNIRLEIEGADIEVDKNVAVAIGEPLVHLVRNSVDHGLETPVERKGANKPEEGVIRLRAFQEGKNIQVEVIDDGRGIDAGVIREKVFSKGLADAETLGRMSDDEVRDFIFMPGFSTASAVTMVSGRGVGLDMVRRRIESIGGKVHLNSMPGKGTTVSMRLPLSFVVHKGLDVSCGGEHYYIPIEYVVETVKVSHSAIHFHRRATLVEIRGQTMRMFDLARIMEISGDDCEQQDCRPCSLVILNLGKIRIALKVERFFKESEYVLKNLPSILTGMTFVQGTVITPDGRLILVLNPVQLLGKDIL